MSLEEQRTTDMWFEAAKLDRNRPPETWEKCGDHHKTGEEARACAAARGPDWHPMRARRVETNLGRGADERLAERTP